MTCGYGYMDLKNSYGDWLAKNLKKKSDLNNLKNHYYKTGHSL